MARQSRQLVFAIPARFGAKRLPGKPLLRLGDKTLIEVVIKRVQELAQRAQNELGELCSSTRVLLATDHEGIAEKGRLAGVDVMITDSDIASGTDRIYAALQQKSRNKELRDDAVVVNIQGDEPFFPLTACFDLVRRMMLEKHIPMGTLATLRHGTSAFLKASHVKVIKNEQSEAIYFSRAPIPWPRELFGASDFPNKMTETENEPSFLQHIGIYAFRWDSLQQFSQTLPQSTLEICEGLEQLRAIEAGWKITLIESNEIPLGVDTLDDLELAEQRYRTQMTPQQ